MSVVGFDIGGDNCVIAVATKQRNIDVILNDESKRETPAVVSFGEKQRFIGSAGAASALMNTRSTVSQVKRLLGRSFRQADVQEELRLLPFATSEAPDGQILIHVRYLNEDRIFTPVQILAMLLSHLKLIAEKYLENTVSDCVIGIPSYLTDLQRRAYLDAAVIAGLRPIRLIHDSAATALGYGIYRVDSGSAINVVFVDIGHSDTQIAVVSFSPGHMRVLSHASDPNLGGRDFDEVLFRYFAEQFKERYQIDVYSNLRASIRLRTACEKLKKVLSANAEAPINIECLMDEKDVKGFIKREEFERLSSGLLERVSEPCKKALADAGLSVDRIHSVELVGSGSRMPAIMRMVGGFFRREPRRTLNVSECVAIGCALQCAMLSPVFRVRDYEVQDSFPFSVGFSSDEGPISTSSGNILFPKGQPIPSVKVLTFLRNNTFHLEAFYADQSELPPGASPKISYFTIGPFQVSLGERPKIKIKVRLNLHGIITIESAYLIEDNTNDTVSRISTQSNLGKTEPEFASGVPSDTGANAVENGGFPQPESPTTENQSPSTDRVRKEKTSRRIEIPVVETIYGAMARGELSEAQALEQQLAYQDGLVELTKERKNALEAFVYEMRNKLLDKYRGFTSESEREGISRNLQQTEDWLYEEGDDESEKVYSSKLEELKKLVEPIENRFKDEEARAQEVRELLNCIVDYRMAVQSLASSERDLVINECNKAEQWLREKTQLQDSLPKNTDPVLWSSEIKRRTEALHATCGHLIRPGGSRSPSDDSRGTDRPAHTSDKMQTD